MLMQWLECATGEQNASSSTPSSVILQFVFFSMVSFCYLVFLAIFRNEITTILTPSTLEGVSGGGGGDHVFHFEGF